MVAAKLGKLRAELRAVEDDLVKALARNVFRSLYCFELLVIGVLANLFGIYDLWVYNRENVQYITIFSNAQNTRVVKNGPKCHLLTPNNPAF